MIDYSDLYNGLDDLHGSLGTILDDTTALAKDYPVLEDAVAAVQALMDDIKQRMDEASTHLYLQEQREDAAARRDYFRAIGPL